MLIDIDLNSLQLDLEAQPEKEPVVVMYERGHHMIHLSQMLTWSNDASTPIEETAYDYTYSVFYQRQNTVDSYNEETNLLFDLLENFEILQKLPWFKKLLKEIIQSSFATQFILDKRELMPDWNNIEEVFLDYLAYIMTSIWPEHIDDILNEEGYFDKECIEQLAVEFFADTESADEFVKINAPTIRGSGYQFSKLAIDSLLAIIRNPDYRQSILPILSQAPIYLQSSVISYVEYMSGRLHYYRELGVEHKKTDFTKSGNFNTTYAICTHLNYALDNNPYDYVEFTTEPGAYCETAGTPDSIFGKHCRRTDNANGDLRFMTALESLLPSRSEYVDKVIFEYDTNWKITSVKIPLYILADIEFINQVSDQSTKINLEA